MKKYIRAVWLESSGEVEGVLPSIWVEGSHIRWPNTSNAEPAMKELRCPTQKWLTFELKKIKFSSDSKKECEKYDFTTAEETSDDEQFVRQVEKRKPKKKIMPDFVSDAGEESVQSEHTKQHDTGSRKGQSNSRRNSSQICTAFPPQPEQVPPVLKGTKRGRSASPSTSIQQMRSKSHRSPSPTQLSGSSISPVPSPSPIKTPRRSPRRPPTNTQSSPRCQTPTRSTQQGQQMPPRRLLPSASPEIVILRSPSSTRAGTPRTLKAYQHPHTSSASSVHQSPSGPHSSSNARKDLTKKRKDDLYPMPEERFQRRVLYLLTDIRDNIKKIAGSLDVATTSNTSNTFQQVDNLDELKELDEKIRDSADYEASLKGYLRRIGGTDANDLIKKVTLRMMTNSLMSKLNMKGKKDKFPFAPTALYGVIKDAVLGSFPTITECDVYIRVGQYLKYAPGRAGGDGRPQRM